MQEFITNGGLVIIAAVVVYLTVALVNLSKNINTSNENQNLSQILKAVQVETEYLINKLVNINDLPTTDERVNQLIDDIYDELYKMIRSNVQNPYYKQLDQLLQLFGKDAITDMISKYVIIGLNKLKSSSPQIGGGEGGYHPENPVSPNNYTKE